MFRKILIVLAVLLVGLLLFPLTQPDTFAVQRSCQIQAAPEKVHAMINDMRAFNRWNPYDRKDPAMAGSFLS